MKFRNSSEILSKVSLSLKNSSEKPWTLKASFGTLLLGLINLWKIFPVELNH